MNLGEPPNHLILKKGAAFYTTLSSAAEAAELVTL